MNLGDRECGGSVCLHVWTNQRVSVFASVCVKNPVNNKATVPLLFTKNDTLLMLFDLFNVQNTPITTIHFQHGP